MRRWTLADGTGALILLAAGLSSMSHRNAPLTPEGRRRLCERVDAGRPICHVATEVGIARQTLGRWYAR